MTNSEIPRIYLKFFENAYNKKLQFTSAKDEIQTIAFGNSQGDGCFDTRDLPNAFNACTRSQDLKYSYLLYKKLGNDAIKIKNVVLFYSFISPGFVLEANRGEQGMALALNSYFDLNVDFADLYLERSAEDFLRPPTDGLSLYDGSHGFFPAAYRTYFQEPYWEQRRAVELQAFNDKLDSIAYLESFIDLAKSRGHNIYFVIPPNNIDFTDAVGRRSEDLHRHLYSALHAHGLPADKHLLDLYHSQHLVGNDFADYNHVMPDSAGTREITLQITRMLES